MRIVLSCQQGSADRRNNPAGFWRAYFLHPLQEENIDCLEVANVDWVEGLACEDDQQRDAWRARAWDETIRFIRTEHARKPIDLFLTYLFPQQIDRPAVREIQRLGIPCVNFFCDNVREFRRVPPEFRCFDLHWVPERAALPMYRAAGLPHLHLPMPCWVPPRVRHAPKAETGPPTFIGTADILRRALLGRAIELGADLAVSGSGWLPSADEPAAQPPAARSPMTLARNQLALIRRHGIASLYRKIADRFHPLHAPEIPASHIREMPLGADAYLSMLREATITIGVNRAPTPRMSNRRPLIYSRLRDIEAPMAGACYLTEWAPELEYMYELGKEIETFRTAEELKDKIDALKRDRGRRLRMREAAQRHALTEHSVARSLARIREHLGFRPAGVA